MWNKQFSVSHTETDLDFHFGDVAPRRSSSIADAYENAVLLGVVDAERALFHDYAGGAVCTGKQMNELVREQRIQPLVSVMRVFLQNLHRIFVSLEWIYVHLLSQSCDFFIFFNQFGGFKIESLMPGWLKQANVEST